MVPGLAGERLPRGSQGSCPTSALNGGVVVSEELGETLRDPARRRARVDEVLLDTRAAGEDVSCDPSQLGHLVERFPPHNGVIRVRPAIVEFSLTIGADHRAPSAGAAASWSSTSIASSRPTIPAWAPPSSAP